MKAGALSGMLAVIFGAFGTHALKKIIPADDLSIYETAVRYQFYHSFALIVTGILFYLKPVPLMIKSGYAFIAGMIFFSGSLYGLAIRSCLNANLMWLGPLTPVGGLFLITGWTLLFFSLRNFKNS